MKYVGVKTTGELKLHEVKEPQTDEIYMAVEETKLGVVPIRPYEFVKWDGQKWVKVDNVELATTLDTKNIEDALAAAVDDLQDKIDEVTLDPSAVALGNVHLLDEVTEFPADGRILVDSETNGPGEMSKDKLLELTAQNALVDTMAQEFDPTRTNENPYKAGECVVYEGKTYTFKVDHYGAWVAADVYTNNVINATLQKIANGDIFYSILKNALSVCIDSSFNVVSGWKGSVIPVPSGMNKIELYNPAANTYSYRVYFLTSNSLVAGSAAPVVYPIMAEVAAGNKKELFIPFGCSYVFVSVFQDIPVNYRFKNDNTDVPVFALANTAINNAGDVISQSGNTLFVIETKNLNCPYLELSKMAANRVGSAYSVDNSIAIGDTITLYSDSEISSRFLADSTNDKVSVLIPEGVNFVLLSSYYTFSFSVKKSYEKIACPQSVAFLKKTSSSAVPISLYPKTTYGDDIVLRVTSTYTATISDIRADKANVSGVINLGYLSYGRLYTKVKSPLAPEYRIILGTGAATVYPTIYRCEAGPIIDEECSTFTFATLNAGCFDHGESTTPTTDPSNGQGFVDSWLDLLKKIDADVIMFSEWNIKMTTGDGFFSKRKLLNNFPCVQEYTALGGYSNKAVASMFDATALQAVSFTNQYSSGRIFCFNKIKVNGKYIVLVVTHLDLVEEYRALQIAELIEYFKDEQHVIISGDFNARDIAEYAPFTEAGYDMANGDMWGVVFTYIGNSVSQAVDVPNDNLMVKGLKINNPRYPYNIDATDHKAVVADVYIL